MKQPLSIMHLVFDYNGTLAEDGIPLALPYNLLQRPKHNRFVF